MDDTRRQTRSRTREASSHAGIIHNHPDDSFIVQRLRVAVSRNPPHGDDNEGDKGDESNKGDKGDASNKSDKSIKSDKGDEGDESNKGDDGDEVDIGMPMARIPGKGADSDDGSWSGDTDKVPVYWRRRWLLVLLLALSLLAPGVGIYSRWWIDPNRTFVHVPVRLSLVEDILDLHIAWMSIPNIIHPLSNNLADCERIVIMVDSICETISLLSTPLSHIIRRTKRDGWESDMETLHRLTSAVGDARLLVELYLELQGTGGALDGSFFAWELRRAMKHIAKAQFRDEDLSLFESNDTSWQGTPQYPTVNAYTLKILAVHRTLLDRILLQDDAAFVERTCGHLEERTGRVATAHLHNACSHSSLGPHGPYWPTSCLPSFPQLLHLVAEWERNPSELGLPDRTNPEPTPFRLARGLTTLAATIDELLRLARSYDMYDPDHPPVDKSIFGWLRRFRAPQESVSDPFGWTLPGWKLPEWNWYPKSVDEARDMGLKISYAAAMLRSGPLFASERAAVAGAWRLSSVIGRYARLSQNITALEQGDGWISISPIDPEDPPGSSTPAFEPVTTVRTLYLTTVGNPPASPTTVDKTPGTRPATVALVRHSLLPQVKEQIAMLRAAEDIIANMTSLRQEMDDAITDYRYEKWLERYLAKPPPNASRPAYSRPRATTTTWLDRMNKLFGLNTDDDAGDEGEDGEDGEDFDDFFNFKVADEDIGARLREKWGI